MGDISCIHKDVRNDCAIDVLRCDAKLRLLKGALIFGATKSAYSIYRKITEEYDVIGFMDNNEDKWGKEIIGKTIYSPAHLEVLKYDHIIIVSLSSLYVIKEQLLNRGIEEGIIITRFVENMVVAREVFLRSFASLISREEKHDIQLREAAVAEAGVFQGEFAKVINYVFPDKQLYLFDTFEGFDERDIRYEAEMGYSEAQKGDLSLTSVEMILNKMVKKENCIIKKGYFPETANGVDRLFCFVNLDMDLYKPTLEGLRFFYPRMVRGGIILVHDYFTNGYEGVYKAMEEFSDECVDRIYPFPIGDGVSIAIQK